LDGKSNNFLTILIFIFARFGIAEQPFFCLVFWGNCEQSGGKFAWKIAEKIRPKIESLVPPSRKRTMRKVDTKQDTNIYRVAEDH
jgi:hypothetical protein